MACDRFGFSVFVLRCCTMFDQVNVWIALPASVRRLLPRIFCRPSMRTFRVTDC